MKSGGCTAVKHKIKVGSPRKTVATRGKNFELLMDHFKVACQPFYFDKEDPFTGKMERKCDESDGIDQDKALLNMVQLFIKQSPKHIAEQESKGKKKQQADGSDMEEVFIVEYDDGADDSQTIDPDLNLFMRNKKTKKMLKADILREHDRNQFAMLEKSLQKLRKKEENQVSRKTVTKKPTDMSPFGNRPGTSS